MHNVILSAFFNVIVYYSCLFNLPYESRRPLQRSIFKVEYTEKLISGLERGSITKSLVSKDKWICSRPS